MINKYLVPPGFRDSLNFDTYIEHKYKNIIVDYFRNHGFSLIKPPLVEFTKNLNKNTLLIKTSRKKNQLSLRNDITPQIIRIASSRLAYKKRPLKLCYYGEVVRNKGTILRPERQFQQVGAEIIGSDSYKGDVEIINLAYETLKKIGVKNIVIDITAPFFIDSIIKKINNADKKNKFKKLINLKDFKNSIKLLSDKNQIESLKFLNTCSGEIYNKSKKLKKLINNFGFEKEVNRLIKISQLIKIVKNDKLNIDFFETENEKYYDGIKFTFFAKDIRGEIAKGGRYILKYGNNRETAIGYTCFMDTILRASSFENKNKRIIVPFNTSKSKKNSLIKKGFSIFTSFENNSNLIDESKNFQCNYYLFKGQVKKI